jgi:tetratricopeptide (TPR) repeat protein
MSIRSVINQQLGDLGDLFDEVRLSDALRQQLDQAETALRNGDHALALQSAIDVARARPGLHRAQLIQALALQASGQPDAASRILGDLRPTLPGRMAQAKLELAGQQPLAALALLDEALTLASSTVDRLMVLHEIADIHLRSDNADRAVPVLRQALRLQPNNASTALKLASALHAGNDIDRAILTLQNAEALVLDGPAADDSTHNPTDQQAGPDAIHQVQQALATLLLERAGPADAGRAAVIYRQLLQQDKESDTLLLGLAQALINSHDPAAAMPVLLHALTVASAGTLPRVHRLMATVCASAGDHARALDSLRAAVALEPDHLSTLADYARAAFDAGLRSEAQRAAESLLEHDARNREALTIAARCHILNQRTDIARELLDQTLAFTLDTSTHIAFAELALAVNDPIDALDHLRDAQLQQPDARDLDALIVRASKMLAPHLPPLPQDRTTGATELAVWLDALSETVTRQPALHALLPKLNLLRQSLDSPLSIAVVGEFNAGKSTFLNALLGEQVLATGVLPTTSHVGVIRYGPRAVARLTEHDGQTTERSLSEVAKIVKTDPERIRALEFLFPHPELLGVNFWDTPGFNAPEDEHESRALDALNSADAIVWLMDASQALAATEFDYIRRIAAPEERLLIVINKIDRDGVDEAAILEVRTHVENGLRAARSSNDDGSPETNTENENETSADSPDQIDPWAGMFAVSGLQAFQASKDDITPVPEAAGEWTDLQAALKSQFFERASRLKVFEVAAELHRVATSIVDNAKATIQSVNEHREQVRSARRTIGRFESRCEAQAIPEVADEVDEEILDLRSRFQRELQELLLPSRFILTPRVLQPDDRALLQRRCSEALTHILHHASSRVTTDVDDLQQELITLLSGLAQGGGIHGRTTRARLDTFLQSSAAARTLFDRGLLPTLTESSTARMEALGPAVIDELAQSSDRQARDAALQRWLPLQGRNWAAAMLEWLREYVTAAVRLCDKVERDLDILALDLEHRIVRPFGDVASQTSSFADFGGDPAGHGS